MTGTSPGATAPTSPSSIRSPHGRTPHLVPAATRTRRFHGAFALGAAVATIHSSRIAGRCYAVGLELRAGTLALSSSMTPTQARAVADALVSAADAAESVRTGSAS